MFNEILATIDDLEQDQMGQISQVVKEEIGLVLPAMIKSEVKKQLSKL